MAVTQLLETGPHLGSVRVGEEPLHLLDEQSFPKRYDVITAIDTYCSELDQPVGLRIGRVKGRVGEVVELTRHEEDHEGLEYSTRSLFVPSAMGRKVLSIMVPHNGPDFGLLNEPYGGAHRLEGPGSSVRRAESQLHPSLHWQRHFVPLVSMPVEIIR